jgi:hypothetical protein
MNITDETVLDCGHKPSKHGDFTTGYGTDSEGRTTCYECCGEKEKEDMRVHGKAVLYLTHAGYGAGSPFGAYPWRDGKVTNWPGTLVIPCRVCKGKHNIAGTRYDVWFEFEGEKWYGVQYGEYTQICRCKRLKGNRR